ncbi:MULTISPECIES: hypothetical protein [Nostocales]|uniref:Uncharacterized protein n=3 Tax=Nostocales TaxID=1161 RepID=A0A0C1R2X1_9CYAN|nr:hypothetical protein [Tolypothrix bouteillei]KAF3890036.1 hypothetical protein DA73_0400034695 [Tolypothrix bouteillei VB521301]
MTFTATPSERTQHANKNHVKGLVIEIILISNKTNRILKQLYNFFTNGLDIFLIKIFKLGKITKESG